MMCRGASTYSEALTPYTSHSEQEGRRGRRKLCFNCCRRGAARSDAGIQIHRECSLMSALVAGVDEAGRGPLAGPVVAAAVILDPQRLIRGLRASKQLTAARRE